MSTSMKLLIIQSNNVIILHFYWGFYYQLQECISYGFHLVNMCASSCQSAVLTTLCVAAATRNVLLSASPDLSVADSCQHNFWRSCVTLSYVSAGVSALSCWHVIG